MRNLYSLKAGVMALAMCSSLSMSAEIFSLDGYTFNILSAEGLTVELIEVDSSVKGDVVVPGSVDYNDATYKVVQFEENLFKNRAGITSLTLPGTISRIPSYCILDLPDLESVTLGEGIAIIGSYNFQSCPKLESFTMPNSVWAVGGYFLSQCTSLKNVTLSNTLDFFEDYAFWGDESLEVIEIPASVTDLGIGFCNECASLAAINVDEANATYASVDGLLYDKNVTTLYTVPGKKENVVLPNTVKTIAHAAFSGSQSLKSVALGSVEIISNYAFAHCSNLETISFPETLKSIGSNAFQDCDNLNCEIEIPAATTSIGEMAFCGTNSLTNLSVNSQSETFASKGGVIYNKDFTTVICSAGGYSEYDLAETVTTIKAWSFGYNTKLTSIKFPDAVEEAGRASFYGCANLETIEFGNNFNKIGDEVFNACENITTIKCLNPTPAAVGFNGFSNKIYEKATVQVPVGARGNYIEHPTWNLFTNIIEVEFSGIENINTNDSAYPIEYYGMDGRKVSSDTKGFVIIRYSDGTARRILQ